MFLKEISAMMHIFGDVKEPKTESVKMVQGILRDQMNFLLLKAEENAYIRESEVISHEDIIFIMRKNKIKLKRLFECLKKLDLKSHSNNDLEWSKDNHHVSESKSKGKWSKICFDFLASIEDCDEFTSVMQDPSIMDITALKRQMREQWWTSTMDLSERGEFLKTSEAALWSVQKFKDWLLEDKVTDLDLTDCAVKIIEFLARETIAEIVDMVLLMKMQKLGKSQVQDYYANLVHLQIHSKLNSDINNVSNITDDCQSACSNLFLNEASNETKSDSVPFDFEDVSDEDIRYVPDTEVTKSNDIRLMNILEHSNMSDTDLLSSTRSPTPNTLNNCLFSSDGTFQKTPAADTLNQSQETNFGYELCNISDASDHEYVPEPKKSCNQRKQPKRKISTSKERRFPSRKISIKPTTQKKHIFAKSAATDYLSVSAKNEVEYKSPIEPSEIADAFARFQEPSPLVKTFNIVHLPRRTKLICLADSLSFDIL